MNLGIWWERRKYWQKSLMAGLVLTILNSLLLAIFLDEFGLSDYRNFIAPILLAIMVPAFIIAILSQLTRNRGVFLGGVVGLFLGTLLSSFEQLIIFTARIWIWFVQCKQECILAFFVAYLTTPLILTLLGMIVGFIISYIKRRK